jgi:uncharacterized protein (TIGR02598 family)
MKPHASNGFSLIEIAVAISIASFCLLAILGLMSVSFRASQQAGEYTTMAGAANWIISKAQADSAFALPSAAPTTLYFDAWGQNTAKRGSAKYACAVTKTSISEKEISGVSGSLSRIKMEFWQAALPAAPRNNPNIIYATLP